MMIGPHRNDRRDSVYYTTEADDGGRWVYVDKAAFIARWAEKRPLGECPECGTRNLAVNRRHDRSSWLLAIVSRLFGGDGQRREVTRTWSACQYCGYRTPTEKEVTTI